MPASVLLVANDPDSVVIYSLMLEHHGYTVVAVRDGAVGYDLAVANAPDIVVFELYLAMSESQSLLRRLRSNTGTSEVPIILLDSVPTQDHGELDPVGRSTMLDKPCEPSRLLAEIQKLLGRLDLASA